MRLFRRKAKAPPLEEFIITVAVYRDGDYVVAGKVDDAWIEGHQGVTVKVIRIQTNGMTTDEKRRVRIHTTAYVIDPIDRRTPTAAEEREIALAVARWISGDRKARIVAVNDPM